jgi:tRNA(fMet)-specific endonuclease VapC
MTGSFLLDTNAVISDFAGDRSLQLLLSGGKISVPSVVIGELYYGAYKSSRTAENVARLVELTQKIRVLACDEVTAQWYGRIKNDLRGMGRPIPQNDLWIAATAMQYGLTLVTRDAHFANVKGLAIQTW